jgi:acyl-CoA thioester hydrolase
MAEQGALTARGTVYPWQCDHMGHMNVMWYVGKFDEATWHVLTLLGLTQPFLRAAARHGGGGAGDHLPARDAARRGVFHSTRVLEVREKVIRFAHEMRVTTRRARSRRRRS